MCENHKESPISLVKWRLKHDDEDFLTALCNRRRRKYKAAWFDYELRRGGGGEGAGGGGGGEGGATAEPTPQFGVRNPCEEPCLPSPRRRGTPLPTMPTVLWTTIPLEAFELTQGSFASKKLEIFNGV